MENETLNEEAKELARLLTAQAISNIEMEMSRQGKTIDDVAKLMGISSSSVRTLLRGKQNISLRSIAKFAVALDARVGIVLGEN